MTFQLADLLLLPIGVLIAVGYTSTGISGANFWVPVFALWLRLEPAIAFWLALVAMLFGSSSGLWRHRVQRTIDGGIAGRLLLISVPAALAGALLAPRLPVELLGLGFGGFALVCGGALLWESRAEAPEARTEGLPWGASALGGLLTGLISVGIGALVGPKMLRNERLWHHARAAGTTLVVAFLTSLAAVLARIDGELLRQLRMGWPRILGVLVVVVPAVVLGGQLGPVIARRAAGASMRRFAALLLVAAGVLMIVRFG